MLDTLLSEARKKTSSCIRTSEVAIISANFGSYDQCCLPEYVIHGVDCFLFQDSNVSHQQVGSNWNVITIDNTYINPRRTAKIFKILTHKLIDKGYKWIVWLDANMAPKKDFELAIKNATSAGGNYFFEHNKRKCVYKEIKECIKWGKDSKDTLLALERKYINEGMPRDYGMAHCAFFIRENSQETNKFFDEWWELIDGSSVRDQTTFPYLMWKNQFSYNALEGFTNENSIVSVNEHSKYVMYEGDLWSMFITSVVNVRNHLKSLFN